MAKKQQHLPTMEPPVVPEIDAAAQRYVKARNARMKKTTEETECHDELLALMRQHGLDSYDHDDIHITVSSTHKAKVKLGGEPEPQE